MTERGSLGSSATGRAGKTLPPLILRSRPGRICVPKDEGGDSRDGSDDGIPGPSRLRRAASLHRMSGRGLILSTPALSSKPSAARSRDLSAISIGSQSPHPEEHAVGYASRRTRLAGRHLSLLESLVLRDAMRSRVAPQDEGGATGLILSPPHPCHPGRQRSGEPGILSAMGRSGFVNPLILEEQTRSGLHLEGRGWR